jgi:hypothetical protein
MIDGLFGGNFGGLERGGMSEVRELIQLSLWLMEIASSVG